MSLGALAQTILLAEKPSIETFFLVFIRGHLVAILFIPTTVYEGIKDEKEKTNEQKSNLIRVDPLVTVNSEMNISDSSSVVLSPS